MPKNSHNKVCSFSFCNNRTELKSNQTQNESKGKTELLYYSNRIEPKIGNPTISDNFPKYRIIIIYRLNGKDNFLIVISFVFQIEQCKAE